MIRSISSLRPSLLSLQSSFSWLSEPSNPSELQATFGQYSFGNNLQHKRSLTHEQINQHAEELFKWAKQLGAKQYGFLTYPWNRGLSQKLQSFIHTHYFADQDGFKDKITLDFSGKTLVRGQSDGSSYPSGGLRSTHQARAYTLWDPRSDCFLRKRSNTLYIPGLMITHDGKALDDKTIFRRAQEILQKESLELLKMLGCDAHGILLLLGLEQEFFVLPKGVAARPDLKWAGRALYGNAPPRNQQLSQHYYSKIPVSVNKAIDEVEEELLGLGIPFKARHSQVALNQFQITSVCDEAGRAIDQNMLTMQILKESFERHDLSVLFHEKPFLDLNGSGKHANWSINYVKGDGSIRNLFEILQTDTQKDLQLFKLFIFMQLKAVHDNHKLLLASIATPGNQLRLGGHEAPPRIFSVYLGKALIQLLHGQPSQERINLRDIAKNLNFDVHQAHNDRNRTSPYAYTGNRFEFRAVGSSQNPSFAVSTIAASLAQQIRTVKNKLKNGATVQQILTEYQESTKKIIYEDCGYKSQWVTQAKKRGLYVNEKFSELYSVLQTQQSLFTNLHLQSPTVSKARANASKDHYIKTVQIQAATLTRLFRKEIFPHALVHLEALDQHKNFLSKQSDKVKKLLQSSLTLISQLQANPSAKDVTEAQSLRAKVIKTGEVLSQLQKLLPQGLLEVEEMFGL